MTLTLEESLSAIRDGAAYRRRRVDAVRVVGPGARDYLQGQVSQDIERLDLNDTVESFLLEPQGKLVAYLRIHCISAEEFLLVVDEGFGDQVLDRLARFKLRVKADLGIDTLELVELRGPGASAHAGSALIEMPFAFGELRGVDLLGVAVEDPAGVEMGDSGAFEVARIRAGVPVMGREITEKVIAQETGITMRAVSFTKGCYTGQELVARIDSRGNNVAKRLLGLSTPRGSKELLVDSKIQIDGRDIGTVTSAARTPDDGFVGLAYIRRDVKPPASANALETEVAVVDLPF